MDNKARFIVAATALLMTQSVLGADEAWAGKNTQVKTKNPQKIISKPTEEKSPSVKAPPIVLDVKEAARDLLGKGKKLSEKDINRQRDIIECVPLFVDEGYAPKAVMDMIGVPQAAVFAALFSESRVGLGRKSNLLTFDSPRFLEDIARYGARCLEIATLHEPAIAAKLKPVVSCVSEQDGKIVLDLKTYREWRRVDKKLSPDLTAQILSLRKDTKICCMIYGLSNYALAKEMRANGCPGDLDGLARLVHIFGEPLAIAFSKAKGNAKVIDISKRSVGTVSDLLGAHGLKYGISRDQLVTEMARRHKRIMDEYTLALGELNRVKALEPSSAEAVKDVQQPVEKKSIVKEQPKKEPKKEEGKEAVMKKGDVKKEDGKKASLQKETKNLAVLKKTKDEKQQGVKKVSVAPSREKASGDKSKKHSFLHLFSTFKIG